MGNAFSAEIESIRAAAQGAGDAADVARGVGLGETVGPVTAALPGARAAGSAAALEATWRAQLGAWTDATGAYAGQLRAALKRAVISADPAGAGQRHEKARSDRAG